MIGRLAPRAWSCALPVVALAGLLIAANALAHESGQSEPASSASATKPSGITQDEAMGMPGDETMIMSGTINLAMPTMDSARGRKLFASKGCVACHSINGVGGHDATALDAHTMKPLMNAFEFAAKMWRNAPLMIAAQEEALGEQILFTGDELADIIAFVHDDVEQHKFSEADIPPEVMPMMHHGHAEGGGGAASHAEELGHHHDSEQKHHDH